MLIVGYGNGVGRAFEVEKILKKYSIDCAILDLRFIKPMDEKLLSRLSKIYQYWFIISDSAKAGGVGSIISSIKDNFYSPDVKITSFEYDDKFIKHGSAGAVEKYLGVSPKANSKKND